MDNRVLLIRHAWAFGGAEKRLLDLLEGIDFDREAVWLACSSDIFAERIARLGLPVKCVPLSVPVNGSFWKVLLAWLVFLRRIRPSKIIMSCGNFLEYPLSAVVAAYIVSRANVYRIFHGSWPLPPPPRKSSVHFRFLPGLGLWWYKAVSPVYLSNCLVRRTLAVSDAIKDMLINGYRCLASKIVAAYPGIDCHRFSPASDNERSILRRAMGLPADGVIVVSTARMVPLKRLDRLVRAFDQVAAHHDNLWLLLVGDGPMRDQIAELARTSKAASRIKLLGHAEDVAPILRASDIYALPSETEGMPLALLEAMASGLVCIASNLLGLSETIRDGQNGFLVDATDDGFRDGLERTLQLGKERREALIRNARQTVLSRFEVSAAVPRELACLDLHSKSDRQTLEQRSPGHP